MIETDNCEIIFEESDPVGTIACSINDLSFGGNELCAPFVEKLLSHGFTGYYNYMLPPEGDFIDMRKVVDSEVIERMIDNGIYPYQKQP